MARIVTVYASERAEFVPIDMSIIRWLKISEALARAGHRVDMATNEPGLRARLPRRMGPDLRRVPLPSVRWDRYDVVKTEFHLGWTTLERYGGAGHPFIISKLGSVVGDRDLEGVYFLGEERAAEFEVQRRIAGGARYVTLLTEPSRELWRACHGDRGRELLVPGGVDAIVPEPADDPYDPRHRPACVFAGNFYDGWYQAEVHERLVDKINRLGRRLREQGAWLHIVGRGDASKLDPEVVVHHGAVPYARSWDFIHRADVGIVFAFGPQTNHNESTKIYHYLRAGLPTVCEAGFPNEGLVEEAGLGFVAPNDDMDAIAEAAVECLRRDWDREGARRWAVENHTWDARARIYDELIRRELSTPS